MASLELDPVSERYRLRFRYGGRCYKRSLKTSDPEEASAVLSRVEETLRLLQRGRLEMPPDADPAVFLLSDGRLNGKPVAPRHLTLGGLFALYHDTLPEGVKAPATLQGEEIHKDHFLRHIKPSTMAQTITVGDLTAYVDKRLQEKWRGKPILPDTIKKELTTFRLIWNWAVAQGYLKGPSPTRGIKLPRRSEKPPFMTWDEIQRALDRGGLTRDQHQKMWDCLFLRVAEIEQVLEHVQSVARHPFIYPMFVFVAHTGARRSEVLRSRIGDFDFGSRTVLIREKKKDHSKTITFRRVPMTELLARTMTDWFARHPGGQYTICEGLVIARGRRHDDFVPLSPSEATHHFKETLQGSKWEKIKGFHVFRHSFASNLAAKGIDQRIIDEWMGHQTEEMRKRYRHLFPDQQRQAIDSVFGGNGK